MNIRRIALYGVSGVAIASWLAAASTSGVRSPILPEPPARTSGLDRSAADLRTEIARLHDRLAPTAVPSRSRDLFRYSSRPPRHASVAREVAAASPVDVAAAPAPIFTLIGIAEDAVADGVVRTAIVSGPSDVYLVKPGDTLAGHFRVEQVAADAVQLIDTTTSAPTTLVLR
jgi:hypothetical protein